MPRTRMPGRFPASTWHACSAERILSIISARLCADRTAHTCTGIPAASVCGTSIHEMAYRLSTESVLSLERKGNSTMRGYGTVAGTCRFTVKPSTKDGFYLPVGLVVGTMTITAPGVALYKEALRMTHNRASFGKVITKKQTIFGYKLHVLITLGVSSSISSWLPPIRPTCWWAKNCCWNTAIGSCWATKAPSVPNVRIRWPQRTA